MLKKILQRYVSGKKFLTPEVWEKKILAQNEPPIPPPPQKSNGQPHREWRRSRRIWHLGRCHPSTKWLARVYHVVAFKSKVLHFNIENTPIKDTIGKRKFNRVLRFLFVDKRELSLWNYLSRNSTLFSSRRIRALGLVWTNRRGSEVSQETWGTFCTLWT